MNSVSIRISEGKGKGNTHDVEKVTHGCVLRGLQCVVLMHINVGYRIYIFFLHLVWGFLVRAGISSSPLSTIERQEHPAMFRLIFMHW